MNTTEPTPKKNKISGIAMSFASILVFIIVLALSRTYPLPAGILAAIYFSIVLGVTVNKHNTLKAIGGDASKLKKEILAYVAWIAVIAAVLGFQIWSVGGFQPKSINSSYETPAQFAARGAEELKSSTVFPQELDSVTTFTDITSEGNTVQYYYIIHDADTSSLTSDALRSSIQPNVCANTSTKSLLGKGVNMQYTYTVKETRTEYSFTVTQSDC
ncbi:MAG: hypothetical protein ABIP74_00135 [Candidatus Saccharimonas sp.]